MSQYSKEELVDLIINDSGAFNDYRASFDDEIDLTETHFNNCTLNERDTLLYAFFYYIIKCKCRFLRTSSF